MDSSSAAMDALLKQFERLQRPIDLVQTLHERQLKEVPARYILPSDQRPSRPLQVQQSLPVIDLSGLEEIDQRFKIVRQLAQASQEWGFFQIINHGIPLSLLESVKRISQDFFELSLEEKRKQCPVRPGLHMLEGYGRFFDICDDTVLDWVDALVHYISPEWAKAVEHWPKTPSTYRETYEKYGEEVMELMEKLLGLLSEGLGLNPNYIQILNKEPLLQVRINYYPPCPQPDMVNGLKPHSDGDMLTVLLDDGVDGLQVRKDEDWFTVPSIPGALIVNIGDLLQIVSNGKYKSAEHRAVANTNQNRMSIVMFLSPQEDVLIDVAPELIDEGHPRLYKAVGAGAYETEFMSKDLRGKDAVEDLLIGQAEQVNG
uniref:Fe2OG dioxygenase domain-containing protein n=1 Tax=Picea sitchensis TaxID=3332 RepID=C0PSL2_PICSI|nr:unknown [Picea sitchensis]